MPFERYAEDRASKREKKRAMRFRAQRGWVSGESRLSTATIIIVASCEGKLAKQTDREESSRQIARVGNNWGTKVRMVGRDLIE